MKVVLNKEQGAESKEQRVESREQGAKSRESCCAEAIPSKSHLHRLLICASLANTSTLLCFAHSQAEDIKATVDCLSALGTKIETVKEGFMVTPLDRQRLPERAVLPCGESGSTLRFILPVVCALGVNGEFAMSGRLPERPLAPLDTELSRHGIRLWRSDANTLCCEGKLTAGNYTLPGNISSQYISGLLLALPLLKENSTLTVEGEIESAEYIAMTLQVAEAFGFSPKIIKNIYEIQGQLTNHASLLSAPCSLLFVEGDWSNAAFWLCAGAMPGGNIEMTGLNRQSVQGDREICIILEQIGAHLSWEENVLQVCEGERRGVEIDARAIPDLVPVLCAVAAVSAGETIVKNAGRLRLKESDRLTATAQTLNALGANITEEPAGLRIQGVRRLTGGVVDACGDHRIAMMAAIASLASDGAVTITGAQAVNKSYPAFWEKFRFLGKEVIIDE
jgi:3-phosphoshikimate 1-carboxyvinyltransferase